MRMTGSEVWESLQNHVATGNSPQQKDKVQGALERHLAIRNRGAAVTSKSLTGEPWRLFCTQWLETTDRDRRPTTGSAGEAHMDGA